MSGGFGPAEADLAADRDLGGEVQLGVDHDGDHRVAAGDRVVGQEEHGQPFRRDLQGAGDGALAGQFALAGALQRGSLQAHADAVGLRLHFPVLGRRTSPAPPGIEPVGAGAGDDVEHGDAGAREVRLQFGVPDDAGFGLPAGGEELAGGQRRGADPGHGVRGAAAQHRGGVHAAADGEVAAEAALRRADGQGFAVEQREGGGHRHGPPVPRFAEVVSSGGDSMVSSDGRPGDGEDLVPDGLDREPAGDGLDRGGRRRVADEAVGPAQRGAVQRAGGGDAQAGVAVAAEVLDQALQARRNDPQAGRHVCRSGAVLGSAVLRQGCSGASVDDAPGRRGTAPGGRGRPGRAAPGPGPTSWRRCGRSAASRRASGAGTRPNSCRPAPPNLRGRRCAASCAAALRAPGSPPPCSRSRGRSRRRPRSRSGRYGRRSRPRLRGRSAAPPRRGPRRRTRCR